MNQAAADRVTPVQSPDGEVRAYTVRGHYDLPDGIFWTFREAYEQAVAVELSEAMGRGRTNS